MKKIITTIGVLVFTLAIGVAYANTSTEEVMPSEMNSYNYAYATNGISFLDTGSDCSIAEGAGAGGLASDAPGLELKNGITNFDLGMYNFSAKSSCEESVLSTGPTRDNGITTFDTAPIEAN
jgi:hypothetical protein